MKMTGITPAPPTGTQIRLNLVHCENLIMLDAFDQSAQLHWAFFYESQTEACDHAESIGLTNAHMRNFPLSLANPVFSFDWWLHSPKKTFRGFFLAKTDYSH